MGLRFCTVDDVKIYANVAENYSSTEATILRYIEQVTTKIQAYTRRNWTFGQYVDYVNLSGMNWRSNPERRLQTIFVEHRPLRTTPAPAIFYTVSGIFEDSIQLSGREFAVDEHRSAITLLLQYTRQTPRALRVEYTAGFEPDSEDSDLIQVSNSIREACAMQAAFLYTRSVNETLGLVRQSDKSGSWEFGVLGSGFIREAQSLLSPHVRSLIG